MARNQITIDGTPKDVFDVLRDGWTYADWVVGTKHVREVDNGFPAVGTKFHHKVGVGPLQLDDHTEVLEYRSDERLVLKARTRPGGTAKVTMEAYPVTADRVRVIMNERAGDPVSRAFYNPVVDRLMKARNTEALRRFGELVAKRRGARVA
jgi:uncharacterized protein YndB with AHSA1/START domain